jgi:CDP-diacylglycerol--serine O-phosphatidyltransferase
VLKGGRYLVPNAFTAMSIVFAMLSIMHTLAGDFFWATWFALYCVLTDKLDGFAARLLRATSPFGVQFDSFADFVSFGVAPAALFYGYFTSHPEFGLAAGFGLAALRISIAAYVISAAVRLARFNVIAGADGAIRPPVPAGGPKLFFGAPTTLISGAIVSLFATMLKYGDPSVVGVVWQSGDPRLLGHPRTTLEVMGLFPFYLLFAAYLMNSRLKVPKLGLTPNRFANAFIIANILGVYGFGSARWLPEYLAMVALAYLLVSAVYGAVSSAAREAVRPPIFAGAGTATPPEPDDEHEL